MANSAVRVGGVITKIQKVITRSSGKPMLFITLEDGEGKIEVIVFPKQLEKNPIIWQEDKVILVSGKVSDRNDEVKVICDSVEEISK
jgi:DNA polymerase-3 subunit alpha